MARDELSRVDTLDIETVVAGRLHCVVAFDWGEEVDLEHAARLEASQSGALPRRPRTPPTIEYRPTPLRYLLGDVSLEVPGVGPAQVEALVFDFGAASISFCAPFRLSLAELRALAPHLAKPDWLVTLARAVSERLYQQLLPSIREPLWSDLFEEYFVFELTPAASLPVAAELLDRAPHWLASLLRLDDGELSDEEIEESLRHRLSYRPEDIVIVEWAAAIVLDHDCEETLHTIEFANLQLLEFRLIDRRVGDAILAAQKSIHPAARSILPIWRSHVRPLRVLNEIRIDAVGTFERASSVLQLVGDQYLARVYRLLSSRFRLDDWSNNVRQSLDATERVHEMISGQSAMFRLEILEIIVILLILFEILIALIGH